MVNYLAIFVVAILDMIIGGLWYGPLFGDRWMKLSGFTSKKMTEAQKRGMWKLYLTNFIAILVMLSVLSLFVSTGGSFMIGALLGCFIWVGFFATTMLSSVIWEGKPIQLYLIHVFHYLVILIISGGILAIWP